MTSSEIQTITDELTPVLKNLPHSINFDAINFINQQRICLGKETFMLHGSKNYLFPISYNAVTKEYMFPLTDVSLPIHVLIDANADIVHNNQESVVNTEGLIKIFSYLAERANSFIQEGELINTRHTADDYVFLFFTIAFISDTTYKRHTLERLVTDWLNTGMCLDRILFFLHLDKPEYSPENIDEFKCMPLDEIF